MRREDELHFSFLYLNLSLGIGFHGEKIQEGYEVTAEFLCKKPSTKSTNSLHLNNIYQAADE
jgi:hypothetical protein